jgi:hypothetical protein
MNALIALLLISAPDPSGPIYEQAMANAARITALEARVEALETKRVSVVVPAARGAVSVVRSSGPSWTWPGDLRNHLLSTHGHSASELAELQRQGLSLQDIHNNDHNGQRAMRTRAVVIPQGQRYQSNCLNGVCPAPQRRGILGLFRKR